ncbi:MAG TPA: beta-galactosidase [Pilimelia sp.]|nr:beta-galactosidase [Pilimelia sp.]
MARPLVPRVPGLCFGGDYNPEQWPEEVWAEDVALMKAAGVNLVSIGIFSWAWLEPAEGAYEFGWLDRVIDGLHAGGVAVDLATASASPPPWFSHAYPDTLPVDAGGRRLTYGSRQAYCPSSPRYRAAALRLAEQLAHRYGEHPALAMWHVNNEYGCHIWSCYCEVSADAFRGWLRARYGDLDGLNHAWGTAFWSQRYTDWAQVQPPRATPTWGNPTQALDFKAFSSDELLACFTAERDLLRRLTPDIPVTTNLMPGHAVLDQWAWAREMTGPGLLLSADHYIVAENPLPGPAQVAVAADMSRSLAGGPWLLMEHSTSAVNWQPRNLAKPPGQLIRDSLGHVARGSDGAMFFQWRASRAGAEKWHSAMVPHAGVESKVGREVAELGRHLAALGEVAGSVTEAGAAVLLDFRSAWAQEAPSQPSGDMTAFQEVGRWHAALYAAGVTTDVAPPEADLGRYPLVVAPALYLLTDAGAANLSRYVAGGGTLVVGPYSGMVDEHDHIRPAPLPGALSGLLGVAVEEFFPLPAGATVRLDNGAVGQVWTEVAAAVDATVVARYLDGPLPGLPALTRRAEGAGTVWYAATRLADGPLGEFLADLAGSTGAGPVLPEAPPGLEAVRRRQPGGQSYLFLLNHGDEPARVAADGVELLTGAQARGTLEVAAGGVAVVREVHP